MHYWECAVGEQLEKDDNDKPKWYMLDEDERSDDSEKGFTLKGNKLLFGTNVFF